MRVLIIITIILYTFFSVFISQVSAAINYTLTPIRYEVNMQPGETKTLPASIRNNGTWTVTLPATVSDFQSNGLTGVPSIVRKSELVYPDQELSTWISLSANSVTLAPGEEGTINFTISAPTSATPGGHYGAVIFNNPGTEVSSGWNISINVDYGILILVNIAWDVIVDAEIWNPNITVGWWATGINIGNIKNVSNVKQDNSWYLWTDTNGESVYQVVDNCPFWDLTKSRYDGSCINIWQEEVNTNYNPLLFSTDDFEVDFTLPIKNIWNTHIKPTGKVILIDEDGEVIKWIWKISVENEQWAVIWDKIVDYVPINDEGGNVLPQTSRIFDSKWKWFPYQTYDDTGAQIIKYWTPSEYYTQKNKEDAGFLMFWERVSEVRQDKNITANIELSYLDENGEEIMFNAAKDFQVQYIEEKVTLNPYIIIWTLVLLFTSGMVWGALRWWLVVKRKRKCWKCREVIKAHWETCPYCKTIQNKKEHKKFEKQSEQKSKKS